MPIQEDHDLLVSLNSRVASIDDKLAKISTGDLSHCASREQRLKTVEDAVLQIRRLADGMPSKDAVRRAHERLSSLQNCLLAIAAFAGIEAFALIKMLFLSEK